LDVRDTGGIMKLRRRHFLHLAAGAAALPTLSRNAKAQTYPTRSVRIIAGFPAGSAADIVARLVGQPLSERIGQPVVIEDRPSAGSNLATEFVLKSPPDGYLLFMATVVNAINPTLYPDLNFNFVRDIAPVARIGGGDYVMVVTPSVPAKTVAEFIAYAKANPGKINMASPGNGTAVHVFGELFKMMTGIDMVHVPYRTSYLPDLLAGQVQVAFTPIPFSIEYIKAGKLRGLAVTGATRSDALPDLPTVGEFVPGYAASGWFGLVAPKGTPNAIIDKLNTEINAVVADPDMKTRLVGLGVPPMPMTPAAFGQLIAEDTDKWAKVIRAANIKAE
jgi:tripartite-type tricarboxylate transporter receptor subunit TctC